MTIDFWELGLQAVNVLILVWLLSRLFWRPVAGAIARRQDTAKAILADAEAARTKADAVLSEVTQARAEIAAEREALLTEAAAKAEAATKKALRAAGEMAEQTADAARIAREREAEAARGVLTAQATELAVDISTRLLRRLDAPVVQAAFLALLVQSIEAMAPGDRAVLVASVDGIDMVSAVALDDADRARVAKTVGEALGGTPRLNFLTSSDLIAGFELRTAHFVLCNSWQSDLERISKDMGHVA